jgi:hypothetical protein
MLSYRPQSLEGKSLLCEKRARIIELFDQLLAKLGGEELSANITMGKVSKEWHDALSAWLDSESRAFRPAPLDRRAGQGRPEGRRLQPRRVREVENRVQARYFGRSEGIFAIVSRWCLEHAAMHPHCP